MWRETLDEFDHSKLSVMAGVSNIGNDRNWTGHLFGQANWYGFGRLAWDYDLNDSTIANEWIRLTFSNKHEKVIKEMMLSSHQALVNYMTPLGLHHIMGANHHYGPGPWVDKMSRADWTSTYYHKADSIGIGFDRTETGSNAIAQYPSPDIQSKEKYLLWFHHVRWDEVWIVYVSATMKA